MENIIEELKSLVEEISEHTNKFTTKKNNAAGTRARKSAQQIKNLMQKFRSEVLVIQKERKEAKKSKKSDSN